MTDNAVAAARIAQYEDDGYDHVSFTENVRVVRGVFKCCGCGAIQADYALPGTDNVVSCDPCSVCDKADEFDILELVGRVDGGPEVDLLPIYQRDIPPLRKDTTWAK